LVEEVLVFRSREEKLSSVKTGKGKRKQLSAKERKTANP